MDVKMNTTKKFRWVNDDIKVDISVLPFALKDLCMRAEEMDIAGDWGYSEIADAIDIEAKNIYVEGGINRKTWDKLVERYPYV